MKTKILMIPVAAIMLTIQIDAEAQKHWKDAFNKFVLETRADFKVMANDSVTNYGFQGKYLNLMMGGNMGNGFSYYLRQRFIANAGSVNFFDNTDFLYVNYKANDNWQFRLGKDAMAVGGFEYDAPPIDVLFSTVFWDNFYCFQLAVGESYTTDDGNHIFTAQVSASPYIKSYGLGYESGLMAYNLMWNGTFDHVHMLWSTNMLERKRGTFMNYTAIGTKLAYDKWDIYLDVIHHALAADDWGKNYAVISCLNFRVSEPLQLWMKFSYEQNESEIDLIDLTNSMDSKIDCLRNPGHYTKAGIGFEYWPKGMKSTRLHGFIAYMQDLDKTIGSTQATKSLYGNIGVTWTMDFHKLFNESL